MTPPAFSDADQLAEMSIGAFAAASGLLSNIFGNTTEWQDLAPFSKVLSAMRVFPEPMQQEYYAPVIRGFFDTLGLDPTDAADRALAVPFADNLALALTDVTSVIVDAVKTSKPARPKGIITPRGGVI